MSSKDQKKSSEDEKKQNGGETKDVKNLVLSFF